jgi:tetratricopeptide (TPR) repeat protein
MMSLLSSEPGKHHNIATFVVAPLALGIVILSPVQGICQSVTQKAQSSTCAINAANVGGNLTIACEGIPSRALRALEIELNSRRVSEQQAREEANRWHTQYDELLRSVSEAGLSEGLRIQALRLLESGELLEAAKIFDKAITQDAPAVQQVASMHFTRGLIAEIQFDTSSALAHYERAWSFAPGNPIVASAYSNLLLKVHSYGKAAEVFEALLDHPSSLPGGKESIAASFLNVGSAYKILRRFGDAEKAYSNAKKLFEEVAQQGSLSAKRNEAAAVLGTATLRFQLGDRQKAAEMTEVAVTLVRAGLEKDGTGTDQLASALTQFADFNSEVGEIKKAFKNYRLKGGRILCD